MKPSEDPFQAAIRSARKTRLLVALFSAATLAVIAGFLFFVTGINIRVEPADAAQHATIEIDNGLGVSFGSDILTASAEIVVTVSAPGFAPNQTQIEVRNANGTATIRLDPLPGYLVVDVRPEEANGVLLIDGKPYGKGPHHEIELPKGAWEIGYRHPRYAEYSKRVEILGKARRQTLSIELQKTAIGFSVNTIPAGADVYIDDILFGKTPRTIELAVGKHTIRLRLDGYVDLGAQVQIAEGSGPMTRSFTLRRTPGILRLSSKPSRANISVDKKFVGQTPVVIPLDPETAHQILLTKPGYQNVVRQVTLGSGKQERLTLSLPPNLGKVRINSEPSGEVWVDGKRTGTTPLELELTTIEHRFEIKRSGYRASVKTLVPTRSYVQEIDLRLKTVQQARLDEAAKETVNSAGQKLLLFVPGHLTMGAPRNEAGQRANEIIRDVILTKPFYLGQNEVTAAQFSQFRNTDSLGSEFRPSNLPMTNVSWVDAAAYCNWLSRREGLDQAYTIQRGRIRGFDPRASGYRLPTESEWAWVSRYAGSGKRRKPLKFPWGAALPVPPNAGNFADESAKTGVDRFIPNYDDGFSGPAPVGSFPKSAAGLNDIGGNVSEWTNDYHDFVSSKIKGPEYDRLGPSSGEAHVIRGASWKSSSLTTLRLSYRDFGSAGRDDVGFRIARWLGD